MGNMNDIFSAKPITPLERKRQAYPFLRQSYLDNQPEGKAYLRNLQLHDKEFAEREAARTYERMVKAAASAFVDLEGNPLPTQGT